MPNVAEILKSEISRIARKEVKAAIAPFQKALAAQRTEQLALKREMADLRKQLKAANSPAKVSTVPFEAPTDDEVKRRFSPKRLAAHRQKLGLSASEYGRLVGISDQSIYHYEQGKARPHANVIRKLSILKGIPKKKIMEMLNAGNEAVTK